MVSLMVGAAFVNLTMLVDYYRRGMVGNNRKVRAGGLQPLPTLVRWDAIALSLLAPFSQLVPRVRGVFRRMRAAVHPLSRGVNLRSPREASRWRCPLLGREPSVGAHAAAGNHSHQPVLPDWCVARLMLPADEEPAGPQESNVEKHGLQVDRTDDTHLP
jgi:hypothetical protein